MDLCHASSDLNRYLDHQDQADEYNEAVVEKAKQLLTTPAFDPFERSNFYQALEESNLTELAQLTKAQSHAQAGQALHTLVTGYWMTLAKRKADEILDGQLEQCNGDQYE